ncbi:MAG: MaoC family dehydratase N-terminal domain-containing protein [Leptospirales bacterium]|nr:MaoC family dehydratase N-terminal domain-containing protein [Leptospirales bacterium]
MIINSSYVNTQLKEYSTVADPFHIMNYAAAIGDENPLYFNDQGRTIIAPPMFAVATTWPVSGNILEYLEDKSFPTEVLKTQVHYTEHLVLHKPISAGENISIKGSIVAIIKHNAGTIIVIKYNAFDKKGEPIFTEYIGGMMRGVQCTDSRGDENLPAIPSAPLAAPIWEKQIHIDRMRPYIYEGCTGISFPIHTSINFAKSVGLPDIIFHGTATLAFAIREITNLEADKDPTMIKEISCRFTGMVIPGSDIKIQLDGRTERGNGKDLFFRVFNDQGQRVISNGYVRIG